MMKRQKTTRKKLITNTVPGTRRRIGRLKTPSDVAKYIARCIRRTERGEGGENQNYKLVMMSSILLKALELSELERRIMELEERAANGGKRE